MTIINNILLLTNEKNALLIICSWQNLYYDSKINISQNWLIKPIFMVDLKCNLNKSFI